MSKLIKITLEKLECEVCEKSFPTDEALRAHEKTHTMNSQFVCITCNKTFSRKSNLTRHMRQFHINLIEIPLFDCDDCDESFESRDMLMQHQQIHEENKLDFDETIITKNESSDILESNEINNIEISQKKESKIDCKSLIKDEPMDIQKKTNNIDSNCFCFICNKSFSRKPNLTRHNRQFHSNAAKIGTTSVQCDKCDKSFETKDILIQHKKMHEKNKSDFDQRKNIKSEDSDVSDTTSEDKVISEVISKKFECNVCEKTFTTNRDLTFHKKVHTDNFNENIHVCYICSKSFSVKSNMTRHIRHVHRNVAESPLFQCGRCDKSFPDKDLLSEHKQMHDINKVDLFKCSLCPKKFAYRKYVKRHERMVHKNEKPVICEHCGKSFSYYRKHKSCLAYLESPSSENYECDLCLKIFTSKAGLLYHNFRCPKLQPEDKSNSQRENSNLRNKCSYCDKYFSGPKKRDDHENNHTGERPYECEICSKGYKNATYLAIHKKRHAAEKTFKCSYCAKSFIYLRLLKMHERIHTDERPFKCKYCEKSFTRKHILFGHEILHLLKDKSKDVRYTISNDHIVLDSFEELIEQNEDDGKAIANNEDLLELEKNMYLNVDNGNLLNEEEDSLNQKLETLNKIEKTEILFLRSDEDENSFFENLNDNLVKEKRVETSVEDDKENVKKFEIVYFNANEVEMNEDKLDNCSDDLGDDFADDLADDFVDDDDIDDDEDDEDDDDEDQQSYISYEVYSNQVLSSDNIETSMPATEGEKFTNPKLRNIKEILVNPSSNSIVGNNSEKTAEQLNSESKIKSFICSYCGKQYSKMLFLKIHEGKHTGDAPFKCEICDKNFVTKTHLSRHNSIHKNANKYACVLCNKAFNRKLSLQIHERTHTGEMPFKCDKCEKCFRSNVSLREHQKDFCKLNRRTTSFQCNICTKTFHSVKTRNSHENRVHKKAYERPTCETCGKTYSCRQAYKNHRPCMKIPEKSTERYQCSYCSKVFTTKEGLKYHIRICLKEPQEEIKFICDENDDKRRHKCSFCGKGFTGPKKREDHERIHTGERPFKCDICSKSYKDAKYLTSHKKRHAFKKSFKCTYCTRSFIFEKLRIIHERVHTGERPFQCKHCDKSYTTKYALYSHESVHLLNDEQPAE